MKVWEVAIELNMDASNVVKIEIEASTENKARKNAEIIAKKKYNAFFTQVNNVKFVGIKIRK